MSTDNAMRAAVEALSLMYANSMGSTDDEISARLRARSALSLLHAALEAREEPQEPVAWGVIDHDGRLLLAEKRTLLAYFDNQPFPLYASPIAADTKGEAKDAREQTIRKLLLVAQEWAAEAVPQEDRSDRLELALRRVFGVAGTQELDEGVRRVPHLTRQLEIKPNDRRPKESHRSAGEEDHRRDQSGRGAEVHPSRPEFVAHGGNALQHEVAQGPGPSAPAGGEAPASEFEKMRAEFEAWVQDRGCDTDGAWSAWQAAWNRRPDGVLGTQGDKA